jgi:hypothetical protein
MSKIDELKAKLIPIKKKEDELWELKEETTKRWLEVSYKVDLIKMEITHLEIKDAARKELLAEIQAQQSSIVPTSTVTETSRFTKLES